MRTLSRLAGSAAAVLLLVPGWSGEPRLDLLGRDAVVHAVPVALDHVDPARRRVGALTFLGGIALSSPDPAFGGFSSLSVRGGRVTLLSDGGNIVSFGLAPGWRIAAPVFGTLPAGPGTGWHKWERDSEAMAVDPASGTAWVGFENANAIWRYTPGLASATGAVRPAAMRRWPPNGGPESLARLPGGRFVAIREVEHERGHGWRTALLFPGDPVATTPARFRYLPPAGYDPSDAAALPDGSLLVLVRRFRLPFHWDARLERVPATAIRPGALAIGRPVAAFDTPLVHDNLEGVAVTRGADGAPVIWLCSDDNRSPLQRSLLLAFRLDRPGHGAGDHRP